MKHPKNILALLAVAALLSACGDYDHCVDNNSEGDAFEKCDPYKPVNEKIFTFNLYADKWVIGPVAHAYHEVPDEGRAAVSNFLTNLSEPLQVIDTTFQGNLQGAGISLWRFILNSTFGFGGLRDFAGENGLPYQDQDFGKTLGTWGIDQGPYVVLPLVGPSTTRNTGGYVVDWFADPVGWYENTWTDVGQTVADGIVTRDEQDAIVDQLYYQSLEPYSATRAAYLQHEFNPATQSGGTK
jgi:phospholipid-binding lipoprotein MlaA